MGRSSVLAWDERGLARDSDRTPWAYVETTSGNWTATCTGAQHTRPGHHTTKKPGPKSSGRTVAGHRQLLTPPPCQTQHTGKHTEAPEPGKQAAEGQTPRPPPDAARPACGCEARARSPGKAWREAAPGGRRTAALSARAGGTRRDLGCGDTHARCEQPGGGERSSAWLTHRYTG